VRISLAFLGLAAVALACRVQAQPAPTTNVQIVNATSVAVITLKLNDAILYDAFPQGNRSGDAPIRVVDSVYEAEDKRTGLRATSDKIKFEPSVYQTLVIFGDFSVDPPQVSGTPNKAETGDRPTAPRVFFQVFSHSTSAQPVRLRIVNGLPGRNLTFVSANEEMIIKPGAHAILTGQPAIAQYTAKIDGESIPLLMRQEGLTRNTMVIFFMKNGKPTFMRAFENTAESSRKRSELERQP
jgi:hypothetical protein